MEFLTAMNFLTDNWLPLAAGLYVCLDLFWPRKDVQRLEKALADSQAAYTALLKEHEAIHAGFHRHLLGSDEPEAVALRERIESQQGRIARARIIRED